MPILAKLSDKEVKRWIYKTTPRAKTKEKTSACITLSRCSGSGGKLVAKKVAQKLGFKFYNKKVIRLIARQSKKRKSLVESLDESSQDLVNNLLKSLIGEDYLSGRAYIKYLCQVILTLAKRGNVVILGRGGNFIIPKQTALRVKITAPFEIRVKNTRKFEKMSAEKARDFVLRVDKKRKNFVSNYFYKNIRNANYYDLVISTEHITVYQAADIVIKAFKEKLG